LNALQAWGVDARPGEVLSFKSLPGLDAPVSVRRTAAQPQGNYLAFYAQLRDHLWGWGSEPLVTPRQVHAVMQLLTLGEQSAREGCCLSLPPVRAMSQPA
jgi:hypothetical protein